MDKKEILALSDDALDEAAWDLYDVHSQGWNGAWSPSCIIGTAMTDLFESVYERGGKIKSGAWVLGTSHNGRDCAHACLLWKAKSFTKFRPLKVEATCPRGEMARAITLCWVCAMLGVSDV